MSKSNTFEEIRKHQEAIEKLKSDAVAGLKKARKAHEVEIKLIDEQIEKLLGKTQRSVSGVGERKLGGLTVGNGRKKRTSVTIEQIVAQIKAGKTNSVQIGAALGCNKLTVANKIKKEGKAAGIGHTGTKRSFAYTIKK